MFHVERVSPYPQVLHGESMEHPELHAISEGRMGRLAADDAESATLSTCICGCRQVVRHELPKLASAGSSPVTRSSEPTGPAPLLVPGLFMRGPGLEPGGRETERTRERSPASVRGRAAPEAARAAARASPVTRSSCLTSPAPPLVPGFRMRGPGLEPEPRARRGRAAGKVPRSRRFASVTAGIARP